MPRRPPPPSSPVRCRPGSPDDAPRFGDVPEAPSGPQPPLRFPGHRPRGGGQAARRRPPPRRRPRPRPRPRRRPSRPGRRPFDVRPLGADDANAFWDPPVVATAAPGRFEELVAAAARAEAEAQASGSHRRCGRRCGRPSAEPELREITPDRPLTSDPVSGEWAVASGLGGNVGVCRSGGA